MDSRYARQSFLGAASDFLFASVCIGIVGTGGGGSHIVQQLAHIGVRRFAIYDGDLIEETNLNRTVGAKTIDVFARRPKVEIARRQITDLQNDADIKVVQSRWQTDSEPLAACDLVFGCVDGLRERDELETFCRRQLIPYIDIGMDVFCYTGEPPRMAGQVILSIPGGPCMKCLNFLNAANMAHEAAQYGGAGPRPQVVWPNGLLASSAVGLGVEMITGWTQRPRSVAFLSYDGNLGLVSEHPMARAVVDRACGHYPLSDCGLPRLRPL